MISLLVANKSTTPRLKAGISAAKIQDDSFDFWTEVDKSLKRQGVWKNAK